MDKKRGQITIFVVIGVILLFSSAVVFFIRNELQGQKISADKEPILAEVPSELLPVKKFVDDCIKRTAIDSLTLIGEHGGYIDLGSDFLKDKVTFREKFNNPTESDYVRFGGMNNELKIPYWQYLKSKNDMSEGCVFTSKQPPLRRHFDTQFVRKEASIESQLDDYVNNNLPECLGDFGSLRQQGFDISSKGITTLTTVAEKEVRFLLEMPLDITKGSDKSELHEFYVKIPLELKRMYSLAAQLATAQSNFSFLERHVLDMIESFSDTNPDKLPPTSETELKFGSGTIWSKIEVEKNLQSMLAAYIRGLQIKGSKNYYPRQSDSKVVQKAYNNMIVPIGGYDDFNVYFDYLGWPLYFNVNADGNSIKPQSASTNYLSFLGLQRYNTEYDLSFPVYIEIQHPPTLEFKDGYRFVFFIEGNIRVNGELDCNDLALKVPDTPVGSLFCNEDQRNSGLIDLEVIDAKTLKPLQEAEIVFTVLDESCSIGRTDENGKLSSNFPVGYGGTINILKQDYFSMPIALDIGDGDSFSLGKLRVEPKVQIEVDIQKLDYVLGQLSRTGGKLSSDEFVVITLAKIKEDPNEEEFITVDEIRGDEGSKGELRLVPGRYQVSISLMKEKKVIIPSDKRKAGSWPFDSDYTIPEINLPDPHPSGGVEWKEFRIDASQLNSGRMTFKVISLPDPQKMEDLNLMTNMESLSNAPINKLLLWPR